MSANASVLSDLFYERETEYFEMTPYSFLDRIGQLIVDCYFESLSLLRGQWLPQAAPFLSETQVAAALTQWTLMVEASIDKNFELFETYVMKNVLALPASFPLDSDRSPSDAPGTPEELDSQLKEAIRALKAASAVNRSLRQDAYQLDSYETAMSAMAAHLSTVKARLQQARMEDSLLGRQMAVFGAELNALKLIVRETLEAGTNYLFAKYDSEHGLDPNAKAQAEAATSVSNPSSSYRRILEEMAGLSASIQSAEQKDAKRREVLQELAAANKVASTLDLDNFRRTLRANNNTAKPVSAQ
jgi:hypothetical protein